MVKGDRCVQGGEAFTLTTFTIEIKTFWEQKSFKQQLQTHSISLNHFLLLFPASDFNIIT